MRNSLVLLIFVLSLSFSSAQEINDNDRKTADPKEDHITWNFTSYDFGEIPKGKPVKATFEYVNKGEGEIHITKVVSSCGCTVAEYTADPVKSGESAELTATFDAAKFGGFNKLITVYMSDETHYKLYLKGTVGSKPAKAGEKK